MKQDWQKKYIKEPLRPDPKFGKRLRDIYLASYEERYSAYQDQRAGAGFVFVMRGLATGVLAVITLVSLSVYANSSDQGIRSALYPLKRAYESVEFGLSRADKKGELNVEQAERRARELIEAGTAVSETEKENLLNTIRDKTGLVLQIVSEGQEETGLMMKSSSLRGGDAELMDKSDLGAEDAAREEVTAPQMTSTAMPEQPNSDERIMMGEPTKSLGGPEKAEGGPALFETERFEIESSRLKYQRSICEKSRELFSLKDEIRDLDEESYNNLLETMRVCETRFGYMHDYPIRE